MKSGPSRRESSLQADNDDYCAEKMITLLFMSHRIQAKIYHTDTMDSVLDRVSFSFDDYIIYKTPLIIIGDILAKIVFAKRQRPVPYWSLSPRLSQAGGRNTEERGDTTQQRSQAQIQATH